MLQLVKFLRHQLALNFLLFSKGLTVNNVMNSNARARNMQFDKKKVQEKANKKGGIFYNRYFDSQVDHQKLIQVLALFSDTLHEYF